MFGRKYSSRDQSLAGEPHLRDAAEARVDPSELKAARKIVGTEDDSFAEEAERSVHDEPAHTASPDQVVPENALTYARWFARMREETGAVERVVLAFLIVLAAGPIAVLGTFMGSMYGPTIGYVSFIAIAVVGPTIEEVMKSALIGFAVEKKPFVLISRAHIVAMGALSGVAFAVIENVLYLKVYFPDPEPWLVAWRWTVCVALHAFCSTLACYGLAKVWHDGVTQGKKPSLDRAYPYLVGAILVHGLYNGCVVLLEAVRLV